MAPSGENINPRSWPFGEASLVNRLDRMGGECVRVVLTQDRDYRPLLSALRDRGKKIIAAFDGDSLGMDPARWPEIIRWYVAKYGDLVHGWQFFNEPDMPPEASHSWPMTLGFTRQAVAIARAALPTSAYLLTPGLGNGYPWYLPEIDWYALGCQGIATQGIYGRWPTEAFAHLPGCRFGSQDEVLDRVAARAQDLGIDAWVTEWGFIYSELGSQWAPVIGATARKLAADTRFKAALHFQLYMEGFGVLAPDGGETEAYTALATTFRAETSTRVAEDASPADPETDGGTMISREPFHGTIEQYVQTYGETLWQPPGAPLIRSRGSGTSRERTAWLDRPEWVRVTEEGGHVVTEQLYPPFR